MVEFNPENKPVLTYGEALDPAMEITSEDNAQKYLSDYIAYIQKQMDGYSPRTDGATAEQIAKINIGYWTGYYDETTGARVKKIFNVLHPIFNE